MKGYAYSFLCFCLLSTSLNAQKVYISRFASGDYLSDEQHRIELFNESARRSIDISGYIIMTRQYVARMPNGTRIPPLGKLRLGKSSRGGKVDIAYQQLKDDFMIRIPNRKERGDFAVLFNSHVKIIDAFFYSEKSRVSFLPTQESFITPENEIISLRVPNESESLWSSIQMPPDPAMVFVQINGQWEINSRIRNLIKATEYSKPRVTYVDGVITVKWQTLFEKDCYYHIIERRTAQGNFTVLDRRPAIGNTSTPHDYIYYDNQIVEDKPYEYRIRNTDKFGNTIYSEEVNISTGSDLGGLSMDHFREGNVQNIRFSSEEDQMVRIQILDEEFRQISILFHEQVAADSQMLLQYKSPLPIGKYYLIAETPQQRIYKHFIITN